MKNYDKMLSIYEKNKGKSVITEKYEAVVCGFHYAWDDNDNNSIILAITKEKCVRPGIRYYLNGDVFMTHKQNDLGYDFIHISDIPQLKLAI